MKETILVLDNYDSFTYNLVHIVREEGFPVEVHRNDQITVEQAARFRKILISPGPGIPDEAGILKPLVQTLSATHSLLGICLGHQGIAEVFGGKLFNIPNVLHGVTSKAQIVDDEEYLFQNLQRELQVTHYHSWAVDRGSVPDQLCITAINHEGLVMGIRHRKYDVRGVQFHPESILTPEGPKMISNWLHHRI